MEKIDRLGWAAGISFTSYGVRVGVRANNPDALRAAQAYFPPGWKCADATVVERLYSLVLNENGEERRGVRRFNLLYGDITRLARTRDSDELLESFASDLHLHIAEMARRRVFVHAGVVAWKGKALLLPGRSHAGKSTLVAELVKAGAIYYSDEYAVLDGQGRVHPFARPLQIREGEAGRQKRYAIEALGGRAGMKPLPVGLVILSTYKPGARWRPRQLSAGQGVLEMFAQTVSARRQPEKALVTLQKVAAQAMMLKSTRGEAAEIVDALLKHLD
jgi:hypothetical protein